MSAKMGSVMIRKTQISIEVDGCFRCGTSFSRGWYPYKEVQVCIGEKSVKWVTLHLCDDCATPEEKVAPQERPDHSVQRKLAI